MKEVINPALLKNIEALEAERDSWRKKYEDLETHRASCCWENEKMLTAAKEALERIGNQGCLSFIECEDKMVWRCPVHMARDALASLSPSDSRSGEGEENEK